MKNIDVGAIEAASELGFSGGRIQAN